MPLIAAMAMATPVFGFALTLDPSLGTGAAPGAHGASPLLASIAQQAAGEAEGAAEQTGELGGQTEDTVTDGSDTSAASGGTDIAAQMAKRGKLSKLHKAFGIATWVAMTATVVLGTIQYYNLYGFFASQSGNPCVEGNAVFGQGQCTGVPWIHLSTAILTGALYSATFGLSLAMPDPLKLDEGDTKYAKKLRTHKLLRWVHVAGMAAQIFLGAIVANSERFGLDRANDYRALQGLATVHLGLGLLTYAALTWAGTLMLL